jgi:hypothetical protein
MAINTYLCWVLLAEDLCDFPMIRDYATNKEIGF